MEELGYNFAPYSGSGTQDDGSLAASNKKLASVEKESEGQRWQFSMDHSWTEPTSILPCSIL